MKNRIFQISILIFFLMIFFIFYKGLQNSNIYIPKAILEKSVPIFKVQLFHSSKKMDSDKIFQKNKYYLVNIWASWCVPCREEHIFLMNLSNQKNIEIIGLNYKDNKKNAQNFLDELGNPFKMILFDQDGTISIEWGAYGVPETFLIYNKKIIQRYIGPLDKNFLIEIKEIIK